MATFLICHGAWSGSWAWRRIRHLLSADGHSFFVPTLSGLGERGEESSPSIDLDRHIRDICAALHCEDLTDVVLVGHSYGGMVATGVADRSRERIKQLIYIDAFVPRNGQCLFDLLPSGLRAQRQEAAQTQGDGWLVPPPPSPADTPPELAAWIAKRQRWQPIRTFTQPIEIKSEDSAIPRAYVYCTRISPDDRFGQFASRATSEAGWSYFEIDASHSPHQTAPEALAHLFQRVID